MKKTLLLAIIAFASITVNAQKSKDDTSQVFTNVDKVPEYPGGFYKFNEYVNKNVKKTIRKDNKSGLVVVVFIIEKDGSLTNSRAIKSLNPESDSIAVSIVSKTPKWIPAMKNGKPVRCKYSVPVKFGDADAIYVDAPKAQDTSKKKLPTPLFPGGDEKFMSYVKNNYKMPPNVEGIKGIIRVEFVVEKDGSLTGIKIATGLSPDLDKEAIRIMSESPKWLPGLQNGKLVRVPYGVVIPIPVDYYITPQ